MKKTAVLVIDFINEIVHPEGKIAKTAPYMQEHNTFAKANQVISLGRERQYPIIFVTVGFSEDYPECPVSSPVFQNAPKFGALKLGEWGTATHEALDKQPGDIDVIKHRVSAFYNTKLDAVLRAQGIERLILTGVSTDMAVQLTAREAHDRDYEVVIVEDACATADPNLQEVTVRALERIATVVTADKLNDFL
ncbi:cysteine hydrolase family protein [Piscirickettsia litoralis]|uniref:Isochorismatase n=1 Tax=Piscirickettsia litoralis TaxID=1891921 RepID=A0ABX3A2X9_9GAMM|nr:isochorismatase family cysteine hydrolase [Piscirickettsia litoralis]ODN41978.1 isochorismatase [Piscirickettsia litoralis]